MQRSNKEENTGPFIIGISGASASGKTTICKQIIRGVGNTRCVLVSLDWFYKGLPAGKDPAQYNFDHPDAFDFDALHRTLSDMSQRKPVKVPRYDFVQHQRDENSAVLMDVTDVIIVEGILTLYNEDIRKLMNMKIFIEADPDICLSRRIKRDLSSRGRTLDSVLTQYERFVKPSFEHFILPTKRFADLVVPNEGNNFVAIDLLTMHIAQKVQ